MSKKLIDWFTWQKTCLLLFAIFVGSNLYMQATVFQVSSDTKKLTATLNDTAKGNRAVNLKNNELLENTAASLDILRKTTSPESRAADDARLANAIKQLRCDQQFFIEKAVHVEYPDAELMSAECVTFYQTNPVPE